MLVVVLIVVGYVKVFVVVEDVVLLVVVVVGLVREVVLGTVLVRLLSWDYGGVLVGHGFGNFLGFLLLFDFARSLVC